MQIQSPSPPALPAWELPARLATRIRCSVCGFTEMRTDVVVERGVLVLRECPRCEHRSTEPLALPVGPARAAAVRRSRAA